MSHSPAWNPEEKRNDNRMRRGTSRDRQQNGGLPPGRNYRSGGYNNKDGGYGKDRGYDGGRRQHNRNRMQEPDHHYSLPHHNPGLNFEPMRAGDGLMSMPRSLSRQWNGPSPPLHSSTPSPVPPPPTPTLSAQQSLRQMSSGRKKDDRDVIVRKSPEIGSKLDETRDDIPYVAAGTAPVNRNGNSPIPAKSASPVPMPLVTNFAGPVMTVNRSYPPGFEDQFDVRSNVSSEQQKPHFASNSNQDNRPRRDKRPERPSFFPSEHDRQVLNQISQMNVFQHILKGNTLGSERDMRIALERLKETRIAAEQQHQHRNNDNNRRRERISDDDRQRTYPVSSRPIARFTGDENAMLAAAAHRSHKSSGGDLLPSEEMVPSLIKFMQQQSTGSQSPVDQEDGKHREKVVVSTGWPSVCVRSDSDSSGQESPSHSQTSPIKQNYSAVVARSSRSSTSDVPKEAASVLYSTKAASNLAEGKDVHFDHHSQRQNLCATQMGSASGEGRGHHHHRGGYKGRMATTAPQFVLPDISQPSCSSITSWGRACWRPMRGCPSWTSMSSAHSLPSPAETTSSDSGASSTAEGPSSEQQSEQEPEFLSEDEEFDEGSKGDEVEDEGQEDEEGHDEEEAVDADWTRKIAPMNDDELEYVEWAHLHSRFLDVYCEPSLRFFVNPPVTFAMPKIRSKESQRGGGSPVLPVSIAAAVAAASNKQRNADYSLNAAKTQPPSPPPTTPVDNKGQFEVSKMDVLSEQIWHYHNSITQTEAMLQRKLHLRDMLYYAISPIFPMCGLYVVGSSLNGFGNNSSDMDLCLMITNKDLDQKTDAVVVLNMILSALAKLEWVSNQQLILAKVPILRIKFTSPWQDITVDLNANNSVAIKNTHLLCYYSSFDWRVRPLVSVVKEWAKRKGINDANRSSFTSYSLVLMVIHYLQCGADPSVLPSLQVMFPKRFNTRADVRTLNVTQPLQHPVEEWHYTDKTTLGELFIGFLDYYANKFDYDRDAISVRQGRRVDRAVLARHRPNGVAHGNHWRSQWRCICIEEPFTQSNTAHSIYDEMVFDAIKTAFRDAHDELEKNRDLQSLLNCKPISVSLPHNGAVVYAFDNSSAAATDSSAIPSPTQDLMCSSSANSLNTAMTRSSSSANSMNDGEEIEKEPQPERPRRKSAGSRRHHSNQHHHRKVSSNTAAAPALVASS